jgi:hypothetical protein
MLLGAATGITTGGRRAATALGIALRIAVPAAVTAVLTVLLTVLFTVLFLASPAGAQEHPDAQALADQAIHRLDLQTKLLADQAIHKLDLQTELRRDEKPEEPYQLTLPPETVWIAVIVGVIILLYAFRDMIPVLRAGRSGSWTEDETAALQAGPRAPEIVLEAADELAAQGRFVEAMHVLLLQALADIRRRLHEEFADSMTSREILRSRRVADALRHPLRDVIDRVEWTYFGGHPAARDDYLACRTSFNALVAALHQGAGA